MKPTGISLCSGAVDGLALAFETVGLHTTHHIEIDPFCCANLRRLWPDSVVIEDGLENVKGLPYADVVYGGIPCQPYSSAGSREGFADSRNLWPEAYRIIREVQPRVVLVENVRGSVTGSDNLADYVLADLEAVGYTGGTFLVPACLFGAPHERYRVFIVAYALSDRHTGQSAKSHAYSHAKQHTAAPQRRRRSISNATVAGGTTPRKHRRAYKSRLGGAAHGTASRLDTFAGWPAGQGPYQHDYEPARTVSEKAPYHKERLQALGNAVVPQQALPLAQAIVRWLQS